MSRPNWKNKNYEGLNNEVSRFSAFLGNSIAEEDPSLWTRAKRNVRRHWIWYSIGAVTGLLAFLLILFLVIIPAVVQDVVNGQALPIYSTAFLSPTPDSIQMSLVSSIDAPASLTTIMKPLSLALSGPGEAPFMTLLLPETQLRGNTSLEVSRQVVIISNMTSFDRFLASYTYSTKFVLGAKGKTNTFVGAIHAPITLDKQLVLSGLQNLTGFDLLDQKLLSTPEPDGANFLATASIPNPSVVTFEIGNLTLLLSTSGIPIGNATIDNFFLAPGTNNLPLRSTINLSALAANLPAITASQPAFASDGTLSIQATGQTTTFNGQRIGYYERVLNPLVLSINVNPQKLAASAQAAVAQPVLAGNSTAAAANSTIAGAPAAGTNPTTVSPATEAGNTTVPLGVAVGNSTAGTAASSVGIPSILSASKTASRPSSTVVSAAKTTQTTPLDALLGNLGINLGLGLKE